MIESNAFDVWGYRTPPPWARRALEKGIIDAGRFEALVRVVADDTAMSHRAAIRRGGCSCRRRPTRSCTRYRP